MIQTYCIIFIFQLLSVTGATESSIVGGKNAKAHSRPYMASLQNDKSHNCGGILIREDFILTAAHCKPKPGAQQFTAVLGAHNIKKKEKSQQRVQVVCHPHPKYTGKFDYDIMLLQLKKNATLNKYVKIIDLPKKDVTIPDGTKCAVAGWGLTGKKSTPSSVLKETKEIMLDSSTCKKKWGTFFISSRMTCTTFTKKTGGICQGDSGGPLICNNNLYGITAFTSEDCADPEYPHGFTKVSAFLPWIKKVMQGLSDAV